MPINPSQKMRITPDDLKRGVVMDPNWYPAVVKLVEVKPSKGDGSTNWNYKLEILQGKNKDGKELFGVVVYRLFNEKAMGFAIPFIEVCGQKITPEGGEIDPNYPVGKKLLIYVKNREYEGCFRTRLPTFVPFG